MVMPLHTLPPSIIAAILLHLDQYDLVAVAQTCSQLYPYAADRLYRRVTVILNAEFPLRYRRNPKAYILQNGYPHMDTTMILCIPSLLKFMAVLHTKPAHIQRVKFFVFDKCYLPDSSDINSLQTQIVDFFGSNAHELSFLHITFIDFVSGIARLTNFLLNPNIRNKMFKLFVTKSQDLYQPQVPQSLTNLFLMLNESEFFDKDNDTHNETHNETHTDIAAGPKFDLSTSPFSALNSLFTLTCSTNNQIGLEVLKNIKLFNPGMKLRLKGLTVFHCHKELFSADDDDLFHDYNYTGPHNERLHHFMNHTDKRLDFSVIEQKIDITNLSHLYLKVDCIEHRNNSCLCFERFFKDFTTFSANNGGLPSLRNFEVESFPNLEWLRPHQILENILTPLGGFIKTLTNLSRLTLDLSTPGFKMFDSTMRMQTSFLNKLNERLMEAFFLGFFASSDHQLVRNLRTLQLPDFLTSFIYYKPDFYESLLHTCQCWGCQVVLEKLKEEFHPIHLGLGEDLDQEHDADDVESTYYNLFGYILGKLQMDREVCIPIKEKAYNYNKYPIYKGQPHTLHNVFHVRPTLATGTKISAQCRCHVDDDPQCRDAGNIDNLATTYVVHQLQPIVQYLLMIFYRLENLMIHGIYYEFDHKLQKMVPIFDDLEYPQGFLAPLAARRGRPPVPFGYFKRG